MVTSTNEQGGHFGGHLSRVYLTFIFELVQEIDESNLHCGIRKQSVQVTKELSLSVHRSKRMPTILVSICAYLSDPSLISTNISCSGSFIFLAPSLPLLTLNSILKHYLIILMSKYEIEIFGMILIRYIFTS